MNYLFLLFSNFKCQNVEEDFALEQPLTAAEFAVDSSFSERYFKRPLILRKRQRTKRSGVEESKVEVENVLTTLFTQETEVCILCFGTSKLEFLGTSSLAKEFKNFSFIEVHIGYKLPERVCTECLTKLNDVALFIKMCRNSFVTMQRRQESIKCKRKKDVPIKLVKDEASELQELSNGIQITNINEVLSWSEHTNTEVNIPEVTTNESHMPDKVECPVQEEDINEITTPAENIEKEVNVSDGLLDHLYCKVNKNYLIKTTPSLRNLTKVCATCNESLPNLMEHYKQQRNCWPKNSQCSICSLWFRDSFRLKNHQIAHHSDKIPVTLFVCHICAKTFKYKISLNRHFRIHEQHKRFICEQCGKSFMTTDRHKNVKPFLCKDCGMLFSSKRVLRAHEHAHRKSKLEELQANKPGATENRFVVCEICDREIATKSIKTHMQTHNENRTYICKKCDIEFDSSLLYHRHNKIHIVKTAECPHCLQMFTRHHIKRHLLIHSEIRKFLCSDCGKMFRTQGNLTTHLLLRHNVNRGKPWVFKYCEKTFTVKEGLRTHQRIHTGEKPYYCHVCDESFLTSSTRKKHVARVHGENEVYNMVNV